MIKYMQCVRRKPGLSIEDFRSHWQDYLVAWRELAIAGLALRMTTSYGLAVEPNAEIQKDRGTQPPFDAVLELWLESGDLVTQMTQQPDVAALIDAMREQQEAFIDLERSSFFFASEEEALGAG